ncbi:phage major capsid protein [Corynebacterium aurimucosum]|uniref:phage major capsid protein n=1 Tax=Corynebacterium aurimucosum TaxID=169292 RepID=UPI001C9E79FE|nr:phage major capsid protein [Corynebacterium aurimucosum]
MPNFNNIVGRADVADAMIPDQIINEIIEEAPKSSVMLTNARRTPMSKGKAKQPVLAELPDAYWVDGDTGMKQTSKATWKNQTITAEELAVIVPVPDALIDDSDVPLWDQIRPLLAEAIGHKIDVAALFGQDKPNSWPTDIFTAAKAAGNAIAAGTNADLGADVAALGALVAEQGFAINGFASKPGLNWQLIGLRTETGQPIYAPAMSQGSRPPCTATASARSTPEPGSPIRPPCSALTGTSRSSVSAKTSPMTSSPRALSPTPTAR